MTSDRSPEPATGARPKIFIHLPFGHDVDAYRARYEQGIEPDIYPYGFHHALKYGFDVAFSVSRAESATRSLLRKATKHLLGFDLLHAWANRKAAGRADVIWTMIETDALSIGMLMCLGALRRPQLIGSTVWMIDRWPGYGAFRRWLFRKLVSRWSVILVHAQPCLDRARQAFPGVRAQLMHFGVAAETFAREAKTPDQGGPITIVAAGDDYTRDWTILLDAFGNDPRFQLTIVCRWFEKSLAREYTNLTSPNITAFSELVSLYRQATYVAVPMAENIFSGITVALEAAGMGIPILSSRTGGVPTYFTEAEALLVPPGDAGAMRAAVLQQSAQQRAAMAERAHDRFVECGYTTEAMIARYIEITEQILHRQ